MKASTSFKILFGRFLTRSGDQAWDFAVPLTLLKIFPGQIRIAAGYFLVVKLLHVLLMPKVATIIDRKSRLQVAYVGSAIQFVGVFLGAGSLLFLYTYNQSDYIYLIFALLVIAGLMGSLGSSLMNISVGNDLVPSAIPTEQITQFNSRLRQLDLFTEVSAPVLAGLLLILNLPSIPLLGLLLIAGWNLISFFPEVLILRSIFKNNPALLKKEFQTFNANKMSLLAKMTTGWVSFFKQPIAPAVLAYALLWLSVLSPHGVLLTGYLKDGLQMPEVVIGIFRGLGALFGLLSTVIFPIVISKYGLIKGSRGFILLQTMMLVLALVFFMIPSAIGQYGFLIFILFSRVGLYGFSLGEMQIRQLGIAPHERGEVNGFADALTGLATLALYGFGALLPSTAEFSVLIFGSVIFVAIGAGIFSFWKPNAQIQNF